DAVLQLTGQVKELSGQVQLLLQAIDDVREEFQWAVRNDRLGGAREEQWKPVTHITSMPKDPCATDFGERVNRYSAMDLPGEDTPTNTQRGHDAVVSN